MTHRPSQLDSGLEGRRAEAERRYAIHGAAREAWPEEARALFDEFAEDPLLDMARQRELELDDALRSLEPPVAGDLLQARLLADFDRSRPRRSGIAAFVGARRLIPAGALAALSAAGFFVGAATAQPGDELYQLAEAAISPPVGFWTESQ